MRQTSARTGGDGDRCAGGNRGRLTSATMRGSRGNAGVSFQSGAHPSTGTSDSNEVCAPHIYDLRTPSPGAAK
jgi:hypothetical protein